MLLNRVEKFDSWLFEHVVAVEPREDVAAYIVNVLAHPLRCDMSHESVVLAFAAAKETMRFETFQRIGDWTLWSLSSNRPTDDAVVNVYRTFGSTSYAICNSMLRGRWELYGVLANELPEVANKISQVFKRVQPAHR